MSTTNLSNQYELLKGDKILWAIIILISIFSLFSVYSASSNLEYVVQNGTTTGHLIKHAFFIFVGLVFMRLVVIAKYEDIGKLSIYALIFMIGLLVVTMFTGQTIGGASASRWFTIPWFNLSFQPSAFAYFCLIIYLCRHLTKSINKERSKAWEIVYVLLPILVVSGLVMKDNGSTAIMIIGVSLIVLFIGQYSIDFITGFIDVFFIGICLFVSLALYTDVLGKGEHRVDTWVSRVENFVGGEDKVNGANYQEMQAKAAIVHGGTTGKGPGKSALKQMLPQSASDFIFAIIIEEYGIIGSGILLFLYFLIITRIVMIAAKMPTFFGSLLVISMGIMIFVQLAVNISVALGIIPVTGQPLPLISYGGTSMLITYMQLGIVLNVSSRLQIYDEEGIGKKQTIEEINDIA